MHANAAVLIEGSLMVIESLLCMNDTILDLSHFAGNNGLRGLCRRLISTRVEVSILCPWHKVSVMSCSSYFLIIQQHSRMNPSVCRNLPVTCSKRVMSLMICESSPSLALLGLTLNCSTLQPTFGGWSGDFCCCVSVTCTAWMFLPYAIRSSEGMKLAWKPFARCNQKMHRFYTIKGWRKGTNTTHKCSRFMGISDQIT